MNDYEIDEIRKVRHQISEAHGHDLRKLAEYYRRIEQELRISGQFLFADQKTSLASQRTMEQPLASSEK